MEAGAQRPSLALFPVCLEGENQAGTGAWNHSQLYHLWFPRRKVEERASGAGLGTWMETDVLESGGQNLFPPFLPVQSSYRQFLFVLEPEMVPVGKRIRNVDM